MPVSTRQASIQRQPSPVVERDGAEAQPSGETLEQLIQSAREERDQLLRQRELERIREEIAALQRGNSTGTMPEGELPEPSVSGTRSSSDGRSKRAGSEEEERPRKIRKRIKEPRIYLGNSLKEHRDFVWDCKVAFQVDQDQFRTDKDKVIWAMQYIGGEPKDAWRSYYERMTDAHEFTWEEFTGFLMDQLADPLNRALDAATQHQRATQREGQNVRSFATYLDTLEAQLPPYAEVHRVQHLFSKLRPSIQRAITNYHKIPPTREELISLASTLEGNLKKESGFHAPKTRLSVSDSKAGPSAKPQSQKPPYSRGEKRERSAPVAQPKSAEVVCYNCNKPGHIKPNCPDLRKGNPNYVPAGQVNTGKGRASRNYRAP